MPVTRRSVVSGRMVVCALALLLAATGSGSAPETWAVLVIGPAAEGADPPTCAVAAASFASVPIVHVTTCPTAVHEGELFDWTKLIPAGSVSTIVTLVAGDGPLLVADTW